MSVRVAVIILNWNGWQDTVELIASLCRAKYEPLTVVVIDNDSDDDSPQRIEGWLRKKGVHYQVLDWDPERSETSSQAKPEDGDHSRAFVLLRSSENLGFCAGNNLGLDLAFSAGAEFGLVLNNS